MTNNENFKLISDLRSYGFFDKKIISAIESIPAELFKPDRLINYITAIQKDNLKFNKIAPDPYLCALIAQKLEISSKESILEIGTGTGYLTAIFSKLANKVYTIENLNVFHVFAKNNFKKLRLTNIISKSGNGFYGWNEMSPFDYIFVSGYIDKLNDELINQIKIGGKCIFPVIQSSGIQMLQLLKVDKNKTKSKIEDICEVNFDPLISV
ncbi:MAG: protein-L-isoaspartate O-methyltransferase [SAR116 cluster bacterium]|nr:protein-L-isoaspartate O-methyltransferase [SAR116 cluster bacterium]RPH10012.1 MAG: protein-L-isoaspartate O-methyltransferase [Alphaproteobacteria bacterium TMED54]